ncbi:MAG: M1 family metallopeptidase [Alphaproteobacteria bacterium]|nr:M1 family metallopeptidase [Alphaproteobacteria bacterium]
MFKRLLGFAAAALVLAASPALAARQALPLDAAPSHYEVAIRPDGAAGTFTGRVTASFETKAPKPAIVLNGLDLKVASASIDGAPAVATIDAAAQTITITPASKALLKPGAHSVTIAYSGKIYDEAYGLFRVEYDANGGKRRMLATQFEPADARRLLPVVDQPDAKAVFTVTVDAPKGETAISNMPVVKKTALKSGATRYAFAPSPKMSSYLLFLAVGDLERITTKVGATEIGVVARRGAAEQGRYALESAARLLTYYNDYFGVDYPLPKLDMLAVPGGGGFGAMENWGAILYFERLLLLDPKTASTDDKMNVFGVVAHEMAHQWFGDLVTMQWWDDLWLNEGFASWMEARSGEALTPEWAPWLAAAAERDRGMARDSRAGTHPIVQKVDTIEEANLAFDDITYQKGQAIIRMLESHVGHDAFRDGVRAYMKAHAYGNTVTDDLWRAIETTSGQPIREIADAYTRRAGVPLATVASAPCAPGATSAKVAIKQSRFAFDDTRGAGSWPLPLTVRALASDKTTRIVVRGDETIDVPGACGPVLINAGQNSYLRVAYAPADRAALAGAFSKLPAVDQLGLLYDFLALGRAGDQPLSEYLAFAKATPASADPLVTRQIAGGLDTIGWVETGRPSEAAYKAFVRRTLAPALARVGWDAKPGEPENDAVLRTALIRTLAGADDADVVAKAREMYAKDSAPAALRDAVLTVVGEHADAATWEQLAKRAAATPSFIEKQSFYFALAGARDPALAKRTLDLALNDPAPPRQLRAQIIGAVASEHPGLAWSTFEANEAKITGMLDPLQRNVFIPNLVSSAYDPALADAMLAYATKAFAEGSRAQATAAAASVRVRAKIRAERLSDVDAWLAAGN